MPVYDEKYIKTKVNRFNDLIHTIFLGYFFGYNQNSKRGHSLHLDSSGKYRFCHEG